MIQEVRDTLRTNWRKKIKKIKKRPRLVVEAEREGGQVRDGSGGESMPIAALL